MQMHYVTLIGTVTGNRSNNLHSTYDMKVSTNT